MVEVKAASGCGDDVFFGTTSDRAARYSKINLDIVLFCLNIQDNNR